MVEHESERSLPLLEHNASEVQPSPVDLAPYQQRPGMTFFDGFALLVSLQVGSGIFSSPSQVDGHTPSPGMALIVWILSGLIAWAGAASFAELGAAIPINGGMQEYLKYIYGDYVAFLASWIWILAVKPSSMAILSIIFAQYWTNAIFPHSVSTMFWLNKLIALAALTATISVNAISLKMTTKMTTVFLWLKLTTVALCLLCGVLSSTFGLHLGTDASNRDWLELGWFSGRKAVCNDAPVYWNRISTWHLLGQYTRALYAGLWAFAGWDNANMVAGEMESPARDLPRAIHAALPTVTTCFLLTNLSYYIIIPWADIGSNDTVAVTAGRRVLGWTGGLLFAFLVSVACLGSINVNVFTTSRLTTAAAKTGYLPSALEGMGIRRGRSESSVSQGLQKDLWQTPIRAMLFNALVTSIYILLGSFGALVIFIGLAGYLFFLLTVLGLMVLRAREPQLLRPYRPNICIPLVFAATSVILVLRGLIEAPVQGTLLCMLLMAGSFRRWLSTQRAKDIWGRACTIGWGGARYDVVPLQE
jgi:solute carrier family 7 (L-type amino acid transporter), member 9/15